MDKLINEFKKQKDIIWENVKSVDSNKIINYDDLTKFNNNLLNKVAILKLNGGLGTSMGCTGPKSAIKVKNDLTFLDIIIKQIEKMDVKIPLILMNSLNTETETKNICKNSNIEILHFNQNFYPRLDTNFNSFKTEFNEDELDYWYPPGHGDLYNALLNSDVYPKLLKKGIKYLFISNSDNLGANFDSKILNYMNENNIDFLMEVVPKTKADIKGGALIEYQNKINLLEVAQVPEDKLDEFYNIEKFKYFNTNNIWLNLEKITDDIKMDVIYHYHVLIKL